MASFAISTLAGTVLAELPLDDAVHDLVVSDLLERLPPMDGAGGMPRLLLGPRELGWSERVADLALAPGAVVTLVLEAAPEKAAADLMGTEGTPVRLAAARALRAMGAAAAGQARKLADAALSDPDAEVAGEALQASREMGTELAPGDVTYGDIAQLAHDLEDPRQPCLVVCWLTLSALKNSLMGLQVGCCAVSPGQAALRRQTVLRRLVAVSPRLARRLEPLLAEPLDDPRPEVRLAGVALQAIGLVHNWEEDVGGVSSRLCGVLVGDVCLDVRRRAAALLGRASRGCLGHLLVEDLTSARAALDAEVEALRTSTLPDDRCRMEAVKELLELLK